ncbi:uncharacterized protein A4U43_C04F14240 [Asparagus officinalis]|uniref:RRM domain-containing protein n=1 Tax=Asparagus officinalis TaxID=4686 RepID=A0A5P1F2K9_ASPOF|nr:splicing factor U2af large subunit B-like [Asparagus officinalis]ONK71963.1 uncharacterized protein A4U43_C04F14240 [Asparagus officinalis]
MIDSNAPFARKFHRNDLVLDKIDTELLFCPLGMMVPGGWCVGKGENGSDPCLVVRNQTARRPGHGAIRLERFYPDELKDDEEYEDILEDMRGEGGKYSKLVNVVIPRPGPNGESAPGVGKVFLEYADTDGSTKAKVGKKFGGNQVVVVFYQEDKFAQGEYDG